MTPALAAALLGGGALFLALVALTSPPPSAERMRARMHRLRRPPAALPAAPPSADHSLLRSDAVASNPRLRALLQRLRWSARRAATLERADLPLTVSEYLLLLFAGAVIVALLAMAVAGSVPMSLGAGALSLGAADWAVVRRARRRVDRFNQQLPGALQIMATSLKSGFGILEAIRMVGREMEPPLAAEFTRILDEHRLGTSLDDSLQALEQRLASVDFAIVTRALHSHHQVGGDLAEILDRVAETMREREQLRGHLRALTAEQRFGGAIVGLLPLWVLGFFLLVDPSFIAPLWEVAIGRILLGAGIIMEAAAFFLMRRIASIEV